MKRIIALSLGCTLLFSHHAISQEAIKVELPVLTFKKTDSGVQVPDGDFFLGRHRSSRHKTSREVLAASKVSDQLCSKTEVDGVVTYDIIHNNKPLKIVIQPNGVIEMTIVRMFDSRNADELRSAYPDLNTRLNAIPTKTYDNSRIGESLEIETTCSFASAEKLKKNRIDLHRIYALYTR